MLKYHVHSAPDETWIVQKRGPALDRSFNFHIDGFWAKRGMTRDIHVGVGTLNELVVAMLRFDFHHSSGGEVIYVKTLLASGLLWWEIDLPIWIRMRHE